jgi:integrase
MDQNNPTQENAQGSLKNAQETHRRKDGRNASPAFPKTDQRYWLKKIRRTKWGKGAGANEAKTYSVQIQHRGRRVRFPLYLSSAAAAAQKARDIYVAVTSLGWEAALEKHKPETLKPVTYPTVGEFIAEARALRSVRQKTFETYASKFRCLVAHLTHKEGDARKNDYFGKLNPATGKRSTPGADIWRQEIDRVRLDKITPMAVNIWKTQYIDKHGQDPISERRSTTTVRTLIRNSSALFAAKITSNLSHLNLPKPLPFEGVSLPRAEKVRYQSKISAEILYTKARHELWEATAADPKSREAFTVLLLGLFAGLRRGEIDKLTWDMVDLDRGTVFVAPSEHGEVKSAHSEAPVRLAPSTVAILKEKKEHARSPFVIECKAPIKAPKENRYYRYRCARIFKLLNDWLRANGLKEEQKPLHALRKEFGSAINEKFGINAAADALRHGNINLTRDYYVRRDTQATFGPENLSSVKSAPNLQDTAKASA